jgi:hypothetical protein
VRQDAPIVKVFEAGHRIEAEVLDDMVGLTYRQHEMILPVTGRIRVVGHIDGYHVVSRMLVEVKSQNKTEWDRFDSEGWSGGFFPKYKWQVSCYMHVAGVPLRLIRVLRDDEGKMLDRADSFVDEPFYTIPEIRARILRVEAAAATGVLSAECINSFPCPYFYLHEEVDRELISDDTVDALAVEYATAGADERAARGRKDSAKRALREAVEGDKYTTASGARVTFYVSKNPPQLDKELLVPFLERNGRSLDQFMIQGTSEKLRVTLPKEDDGEGDGSSS